MTLRSASRGSLFSPAAGRGLCRPAGASAATEFEDAIKGMTKGGGGRDTGGDRSSACRSLELGDAPGIESGMLGLGPGPHLEIPPSIVAGSGIRRMTQST